MWLTQLKWWRSEICAALNLYKQTVWHHNPGRIEMAVLAVDVRWKGFLKFLGAAVASSAAGFSLWPFLPVTSSKLFCTPGFSCSGKRTSINGDQLAVSGRVLRVIPAGSGQITGLKITNPGEGYPTAPTVRILPQRTRNTRCRHRTIEEHVRIASRPPVYTLAPATTKSCNVAGPWPWK